MTQNISNILHKLYQKVRHLSKQCNFTLQSYKKDLPFENQISLLITNIQEIIKYVISLRNIEDQYQKLQSIIQKHQNDIRKHIGLQQQLKLYNQSMQQQLDDSQFSRSELLQKTRIMLAELKKENQKLYEENRQLKQDKIELVEKHLKIGNVTKTQFKMNTQQNSKQKYTRSRRRFNVQVDVKKHNLKTELSKDSVSKTLSKQNLLENAYISKNSDLFKVKIQIGEKKQHNNIYHSDRKKQIQKKIRQLGENRGYTKKSLIENNSYQQLHPKQQIRNSVQYKKLLNRHSLKKNSLSKDTHIEAQRLVQDQQLQKRKTIQ